MVSALGALFFVVFVLLMGAVLYAWMGAMGVGLWAVFVASVVVWGEARRRARG